MTSAYYEQSVVKSDLGISGTGLDTQLDDWSDKVERDIDNLIYEVWSKRRVQTALPDLPLSGTDIDESIKLAANAGVKARYYETEQRDIKRQQSFEKQMKEKITNWVQRQRVTKRIYIRAIS